MSLRKIIGNGSKVSLGLLVRFVDAAMDFSVRDGVHVERWSDDERKGWAVSQGAWVYAAVGDTKWRRSPATRWHKSECYIDDLGRAFTRAEQVAEADSVERAKWNRGRAARS